MLAWWSRLFDTSDFLTRSHCGRWEDATAFAYQIANFVIALSYFFIPVCISYYYLKRRHSVPKSWILLLFVSFILLCGWTHINDWLVFYWAPYRFYTVIVVMCACASLLTAIMLPGVVKYYLSFKSPEEYFALLDDREREIAAREQLQSDLIERNLELNRQVMILESKIEEVQWQGTVHVRLQEIQVSLENIKQTIKAPITSEK